MNLSTRPFSLRWIPAPAGRGGSAVRSPHPAPAWAPAIPVHAPVCPLWTRLFVAAPLSPNAVGALVGLSLVTLFLLLDVLDGNLASVFSGEVLPWLHVEVRSAVVVSALLAGVLITHRHEELGTQRDLSRLAPQLSDAGLRELGPEADSPSGSTASLRLAATLGAVLIASLVPTLYLEPTRFLRAETYSRPSVLFDLAIGAVLGWTTFKTLFAALGEDRRFARLASHVRSIDLLDLAPLHPFARRGLRRALRWLLLVSIAALVFFDAGTKAPPALVLAGIFGFALLSFLLPVWGAHGSIRAEKRRELTDLRLRIVEERKRLRAAGWRPADAGGRFADLLAYEARLSTAKTWPFDASTLVRLALYGSLPLGSWLASAFVNHLVDALLR